MELVEASMFYGSIILVGGTVGIWLGGVLGDRLGAASRKAYLLVPAFAFIATVPFYLVALTTPSLVATFLAMLVPTALGLAWLGPVLSTIQHVVPPNMRATASAIFLFINNLVGIGAGTVVLGVISDSLQARYGDESLRYAVMSGTAFYVLASALFFWGSRYVERDWEEAGSGSRDD
jgi:predicted MFS family arabinose efflux permease